MTTALSVAVRRVELPKAPAKAGGVIVRRASGGHDVLVISSISKPGRWTFPKGRLGAGEHPVSTASREIAEEAGVRGRLVREIAVVSRHGELTTFFLFRYRNDVAWEEEDLRDRRWVPLEDAERYVRQRHLHAVIAAARRALRAR